jgi:hypothetical protein
MLRTRGLLLVAAAAFLREAAGFAGVGGWTFGTAAPRCVAGAGGICPGRRRGANLSRLSMATNEETKRKWEAFGEWSSGQGIQSDNLALAEFEGGLRGVAASSDIGAGETVISVPAASVLRVIGGNSRLPAKLQGYVSEQTWRDAEWWGQLALLLLWEKGAGRTASPEPSRFTRWIDVLPQSMSTPLHWTEAEVDELQYQPLVSKCIRQRTAWKVLLKQVQKDNSGIGEDEFYLACEMARSRAFSGPYVNRLPKDQMFLTGLLVAVSTQLNILDAGKAAIGTAAVLLWIVANTLLVPRFFGLTHYVMAPMIDMVNHNGAPGAAAGVTYQALQATFEVLTTKSYSLGDQVYISYGERSNDQLLQYYGFIEPDNANDCYEFDKMPRLLADACSKLSIGASGLDEYAQTSSGPTLLTPTGFDPAFMSKMSEICGGEKQSHQVLCRLLEDELAKFPTTLDDDEAALRDAKVPPDSPGSLALMLRIEKKRLLAKNVAALGR